MNDDRRLQPANEKKTTPKFLSQQLNYSYTMNMYTLQKKFKIENVQMKQFS